MTLVELLAHLGVDHRLGGTHHHVRVGWVGIDCPQCTPGAGRFRLGINERSLSTACWACGGVPLARALSDASRRSLGTIRELLASLDHGSALPAARQVVGKYEEPPKVAPMTARHRDYLFKERGFDPDEIEGVWGVRGISNAAELAWRLFLPCPTPDGKAGSWTTRAIGPRERLRYVSASPDKENVPLKSTLYGYHLAKQAIAIVEGPMDAWRVGPGAVATFGTSYTDAQVALMIRKPVRVVCYDNEPAAQRAARRLVDELSAFPGSTYLCVLSGKDPDSSPPGELEKLRSLLR